MRSTLTALVLPLIAFVLTAPQVTCGQGTQTDVGTKPYGSFHESDIARVNLFTRSLDVRVPLTSYPQRGGKLKAEYVFIIPQIRFIRIINPGTNSDPRCNNSDPTQACYAYQNDTSSASGIVGVGNLILWHDYDPPSAIQPNQPYTAGRLREADGTVHALAPISNTQAVAIDNTGWLVQPWKWSDSICNGGTVPELIRDRNGIRYTSVSSACSGQFNNGQFTVEDPNGNEITTTDTMGRPLGGGSNPGSSTTDYTGCTGPLPISSASIVTLPRVNGGTDNYKLCKATLTVNWNYSYICGTYTYPQCGWATVNTINVYQSLVLPNGTAWTFEYYAYDPNNPNSRIRGDLKKITYPKGGSVTYNWTYTGSWPQTGTCSDSARVQPAIYANAIASRAVDANDGNGLHTWTYSGTTTVTDPLGNDTLHTFSALGSCLFNLETKTQRYQGSSTSGSL